MHNHCCALRGLNPYWSSVFFIWILFISGSSCTKKDEGVVPPDPWIDYTWNAAQCIDARIVGLTKYGHIKIFTKQDHIAGIYQRNPTCWASDLDMTCISPWNSRDENLRAGTLITPRHVLLVAHYNLKPGDRIRFIGANGDVFEREILFHKNFTNWNTNYPDLEICLLDSDLPPSIRPCLFLPGNYASFIDDSGLGLPVLCLDQEEKAIVSDIVSIDTLSADSISNLFILKQPADSCRMVFYEDKVMGDSGNPVFMVIMDQLILLGLLTYGGSGSGTSLTHFSNYDASSQGYDYPDLAGMIQTTDSLAGVNTSLSITYFTF